jgi:hypothetical protein
MLSTRAAVFKSILRTIDLAINIDSDSILNSITRASPKEA